MGMVEYSGGKCIGQCSRQRRQPSYNTVMLKVTIVMMEVKRKRNLKKSRGQARLHPIMNHDGIGLVSLEFCGSAACTMKKLGPHLKS